MADNCNVILTIAGSDPGAGAGIQADIKTALRMKTHACTALTALTVQNSIGLQSVGVVDASLLDAQIEAIATDFNIKGVKIGMLPTEDQMHVVAAAIRRHKWTNVVVDTILGTTVGINKSAGAVSSLSALKEIIFPFASVITPNIPEALKLTEDASITGIGFDSLELASMTLERCKTKAVLLKGGHSDSSSVTDVLVTETGEISFFVTRRIASLNTHGTGCALSTALTCALASGRNIMQSTADAERLIHELISVGADYDYGSCTYGPLGFYKDN